MSKKEKIAQFDPNGIGLNNGHFIGLPFDEEDASIILVPVPWDVTVSYSDGTATAAQNILSSSYQLDLFDPFVKDAWKLGLYLRPISKEWLAKNENLRADAKWYIHLLEKGVDLKQHQELQETLVEINNQCKQLKDWVYQETKAILEKGQSVGLVGGDHSTPLGYLEALAEKHDHFGILQIDAHMDLRKAYEGFTYSHASIFYNAAQIENVEKIVQVGIRDYCEEEVNFIAKSNNRIIPFYDHQIKAQIYKGQTFHSICQDIISQLPQKVYISFDIDGLDPKLCPNTGTPVPGGLDFNEAIYLLQLVVESGRTIIGFDLSEVAGIKNEWDGNVGARLLYRLSNLMGKSQGLI